MVKFSIFKKLSYLNGAHQSHKRFDLTRFQAKDLLFYHFNFNIIIKLLK